jgi:hypothetical protein
MYKTIFFVAFTLLLSVSYAGAGGYQKDFGIADCTLQTTGKNAYFILEPGYQLFYEGDGEKLQITVLNETKTVDGVLTRVVEEREWQGGELYEVAKNYFAFCEQTKDVFYFGEDVEYYKNGKVTGTGGSWLVGGDNKPGLIMPGSPKVGMKYYQEIAPSIAMDRGKIVSMTETCDTPAGKFEKCMKVAETNAVEVLSFLHPEYKMHAPGIGLIQDEDLILTRYGAAAVEKSAEKSMAPPVVTESPLPKTE